MLSFEAKKNVSFRKIKEFCELNQIKINNIEEFVILLLQENHNFNFIGKSTISDIWDRHILDSAQILQYIPDFSVKIADLGSGAGFPGIIISILGAKEVHLIEKSVRKCEFLRKAKLLSSNRLFVHQARIEELEDQKFDVLTSRALASLDKLLDYNLKFVKNGGYGLFLKGRNLDIELQEAKKSFDFKFELYPSLTSEESRIIKVWEVSKIKQNKI
ncbi:MAG TPA: 16S rRNA (guanine(527)-N(7))-methyltransferase RsmG [Rickettsiales bacterium]|nr:16S rRNA (guanine(527)-N(7))-methyltransferase RsmG [Rickettsiales bacterium]